MSTIELGVYILGATALVILAAAGLWTGDRVVVGAAILSSGCAYVSQLGGAFYIMTEEGWARTLNIVFGVAAQLAWIGGLLAYLV